MTKIPETQYATLGEDRIAYQVFGEGEVDLLFVPPSGDCIELRWDWPPYADYLRWLGAQARVIAFDRRGSGASDAPSGETLPSWERWADDARAVLDTVGSERAVIAGYSDSGPTAILFAASDPGRTQGLILIGTAAALGCRSRLPRRPPRGGVGSHHPVRPRRLGHRGPRRLAAPDLARRDPEFRRQIARTSRMYMSPKEASRLIHLQLSLDVREALDLVRVPTLVLHPCGGGPQPSPVRGVEGIDLSVVGADVEDTPGGARSDEHTQSPLITVAVRA